MGGLRVGVCLLPEHDWPSDAGRWQEAERLGFVTLWTYDHLSWRTLRDGPWLGAIPVLTAAAGVTRHARLGTLVATPNFRHPVPFAKDLMSLDRISGGRLDVGLGSGGTGADATAQGAPALTASQRMDRFEEFVEVLDGALTQPGSYTRQGSWFSAADVRMLPGCRQQPRAPFTVAATGRRGLALVARHASTWVTFGPGDGSGDDDPEAWWAAVVRQRDALDRACEEQDRDVSTVSRMALVGLGLAWAQRSPSQWDDFCGRLRAERFTDVVVHWPRPDDAALPGPTERTFAHLTAALVRPGGS